MTTEPTRPYKEFKTEHATFELYEYITGFDKRAIESVFLDQANISQSSKTSGKDGSIEIGGIKGSVNHQMQDRAIEAVVKQILVNGEEKPIVTKREVVAYILSLPEQECDQVIAEINKITEPKKEPATS